MANRTREQRRKRERVLKAICWIAGILLAGAVVLLLLGAGREPDPVPTNAQERKAQYFAAQEYERMINLGADPWSAEQAAYLVYEEMMTP